MVDHDALSDGRAANAPDEVPPTREAVRPDRLDGLDADAAARLVNAAGLLHAQRLAEAERELDAVLSVAPDHAEALRLKALARQLDGDTNGAVLLLRRAVQRHPRDAPLLNNLGSALFAQRNARAALAAWRGACEADPGYASAWFNQGCVLLRRTDFEAAEAALARAIEIDPGHAEAHNARARALAALGRDAEAADAYRRAIAIDPARATAWAGLSDLPGHRFDDGQIAALRAARQSSNPVARERLALDLALGRALEQRGEYQEAFTAIAAANAARRALRPAWDRAKFSQHIDAIMRAFEEFPTPTDVPALGERTIFLVGLARADAAPAERVLCAHAKVALVGESRDLAEVIREQSALSGKPFPEWAVETAPHDWERLGRIYLERLGEQGDAGDQSQPLFRVDSTISNWPLLGAVLTMLPAARVIDCRREALSACWDCHADVFAPASGVWACALDDLGAYWQDYDRLALFWRARYGSRIHTARLEELVADPRRAARSLIAACGLSPDPASVRAAAETRVSLRGSLDGYGARLDSLRRSLGLK